MGKYRYPGVNNFTVNDNDIFFGRDEDVVKLYTQIQLSKTVVLHADSGMGKSSLIQAGLFPLIRKNNPECLPVLIRCLGNKARNETKNATDISSTINPEILAENYLVSETLKYIRTSNGVKDMEQLPYLNAQRDSFWYMAKLYERNKKNLLLIFDQFEELQTYGFDQIDFFKKKLAELFNNTIPADIYREINEKSEHLFSNKQISEEEHQQYNENIRFLEAPPNVKVLFVVREDRLGTMSLLADYFCDILKNDYLLKPLSRGSAYKAIAEPASRPGEFSTHQFTFDDSAITRILNGLADPYTDTIDPIQAQIICSSIEKHIVSGNKSVVTITEDHIPSIKDIIHEFYKRVWKRIQDKLQLDEITFNNYKEKIIGHLIYKDKKNQVLEDVLLKAESEAEAEAGQIIVDSLHLEGVIRKIPSGRETYYQLTHDRLIKSASDDLRELQAIREANLKNQQKLAIAREMAEKSKKGFRILIGAIFLIIICVIGAYYYNLNNIRAEKVLDIARQIKRLNPTLSYRMVKDFEKNDHSDEKLKNFLSEFDTCNNTYLVNMFSTSGDVLYADIAYDKKDSSHPYLKVTEPWTQYVWNMKSNLLERLSSYKENEIYKSFIIRGKTVLLISLGDSLLATDSSGKRLSAFYLYNIPGTLDISPDGNLLLASDNIYSFKSGKLIGTLELPDNKPSFYLATGKFFHDNKHVAVGLLGGAKAIYLLDEKNTADKLKRVAVYKNNSRYNYKNITSIVLDKNDKRMFAGTSTGEIEAWRVDSLGNKEILDTTKRFLINTMTGHTGNVDCIALSPDDSLLISGSADRAILWNTRNGHLLSVLKDGHPCAKYVSFSSTGNEIITSGNYRIKIWKYDHASRLYQSDQLSRFCPFDYYNNGFTSKEKNLENIYDLDSMQSLAGSIIHYLTYMPDKNYEPDNTEYLTNLNISFRQIDSLYQLFKSKEQYQRGIDRINKVLLERFYAYYEFNKPDLLLKEEKRENRNQREAAYYIGLISTLSPDTSDPYIAIRIAEGLVDVADYFNDTSRNYEKAITYYSPALNIIGKYTARFPHFEGLSRVSTWANEKAAMNYLYCSHLHVTNVYDALEVAKEIKKDKNGEGLSNMISILAYLQQGLSNKAKTLFLENEKKKVRSYTIWRYFGTFSLKNALSSIIDKMSTKDLASQEMMKFNNFIKDRPEPSKLID